MKRTIATCFVILSAWALSAAAQPTASGDHVQVRWLAPTELAAGQSATLGFYFEVDPKWHVYWQNAGDSGAAPRFDMTTTGASVGDIQWPFPHRLPIEHLTNLGYEGNVAYLFELTPEPGANSVSLQVNLEWLVCKINCIPGFATMTLERPVGEATEWAPADKRLVERFAARVPQPGEQSPWQPRALLTGAEDQLVLTLEGSVEDEKAAGANAPTVFPVDGSVITAAAPAIEAVDGGYRFRFTRQPGAELPPSTDFVITDGKQSWRLDKVSLGSQNPTGDSPQPLWLLVLAAIAGGVILNLMPCVFPVLSIKLFSLVQSGSGQSHLREGLIYSAGVLVTFAALGGLLLALRAGGSAVGWGFQLQSPIVVLALIVLFWLMGLAFSGVFEFGHKLMNLAGRANGGSFVTGVLAVFVAAPCTGPFMGAALGAATVLPAISAMAIFIGLGIGLAAPFLVLAATPALIKKLPRPGPWMETLKQFFAFPLYATVIWLAWVMAELTGSAGWLIVSTLLLALTFSLWLGSGGGKVRRTLATALALAALVSAFSSVTHLKPGAAEASGFWQPYDRDAIAAALAEDRPVFIDYTAAWCITCQVNKKLVLTTSQTTELFKRHNVLAIRADWTDHNAEITRALEALGRNSVPVYAWYASGADQPELLPQLLQQRMISALFPTNEGGSP
ncbi:protein-disulfide reductase DsbD family protein [Marinimicrobium agarilyticum]|uniref:protein-disulfide reductase DsbD family protein n=1 Tax=Marinimicrobium agarilyticum TaxID=306546 RepID=UPI0004099C6E|nr:protein-disulfide reductase DsbD domain-containing protein [Marinimicrobium agarilyticum]